MNKYYSRISLVVLIFCASFAFANVTLANSYTLTASVSGSPMVNQPATTTNSYLSYEYLPGDGDKFSSSLGYAKVVINSFTKNGTDADTTPVIIKVSGSVSGLQLFGYGEGSLPLVGNGNSWWDITHGGWGDGTLTVDDALNIGGSTTAGTFYAAGLPGTYTFKLQLVNATDGTTVIAETEDLTVVISPNSYTLTSTVTGSPGSVKPTIVTSAVDQYQIYAGSSTIFDSGYPKVAISSFGKSGSLADSRPAIIKVFGLISGLQLFGFAPFDLGNGTQDLWWDITHGGWGDGSITVDQALGLSPSSGTFYAAGLAGVYNFKLQLVSGSTVVAETGTSTIAILADNQVTPDNAGAVTSSPSSPEVVLTNPNQAVTVTIDSATTNATIDVGSFITNGSGTLPEITVNSANANNISLTIPANTVVSTASTTWDGVIAAPTITTVTLPTVSGDTLTPSTAIEVGFTGEKLSFSKAVRILLPNQAGKRAGYVRTGISFTEITNVCVADNQTTGDSLAVDAECKIDVGSDLIIWTKHFTSFATYTQTTNPAPAVSGGGGGGGGGIVGQFGTTNAPQTPKTVVVVPERITEVVNPAVNKKTEVKTTKVTHVVASKPKATVAASVKSNKPIVESQSQTASVIQSVQKKATTTSPEKSSITRKLIKKISSWFRK